MLTPSDARALAQALNAAADKAEAEGTTQIELSTVVAQGAHAQWDHLEQLVKAKLKQEQAGGTAAA